MSEENKEFKPIDINVIKEYLPHRYPFLFLDKIIDYKEAEYLTAIKNVTGNEALFQGHFPNYPIFPGVIIVEAMAQACAMLYYLSHNIKDPTRPVLFMSIDKCKFRNPVFPGDTLTLHVTPIQVSGRISKLQGKASVNGKLVTEAILTAMVGDA